MISKKYSCPIYSNYALQKKKLERLDYKPGRKRNRLSQLFPLSAVPPGKHFPAHRNPWIRKNLAVTGLSFWIMCKLRPWKGALPEFQKPQYGLVKYRDLLWYRGKYRINPDGEFPRFLWQR